jgi:hypothetical protein
MTDRIASKRRWRNIERYIQRKDGRVRFSWLAHRFGLAPSNVIRGLRRRKIELESAPFPWETLSQPDHPEQVQKCRQALALYFLAMTRNQIRRCMPIKSETVRSYILALTIEVRLSGSLPYRMFSDDAVKSLTKELERAYGLGDRVEDVFKTLVFNRGDYFSADANAFLRKFCRRPPPLALLMRKLRQILKTRVCRHRLTIQVVGRNGRLVKVRIPRQ